MTFGAFATLLVAFAFIVLLVRVLSPVRRARYRSYAEIPFDDDRPRDRGDTGHE